MEYCSFPWFYPNKKHLESWKAFIAIGNSLSEKLERHDYKLFQQGQIEDTVARLLTDLGEMEPQKEAFRTSPAVAANSRGGYSLSQFDIKVLFQNQDVFPFLTGDIPLLAMAAIAILSFRTMEQRIKVSILDISPLFKLLAIPLEDWNKEGKLLLEYCGQAKGYLKVERKDKIVKWGDENSPVISLTAEGVKTVLGVEAHRFSRKKDKLERGRGETDKNEWLVPTATLKDVVMDESIRLRLDYLAKSAKKSQKTKFNILFWGPPGTGKTYAATAIAGELKRKMITLDLSRIINSFVGDSEKSLSKHFDEAERAGGIVFVDECDSLLRERLPSNRSWENTEVNHLLKLIETSSASVIMCTNHFEILDAALLRRLTEIIEFKIPDKEARVAIWKKELKKAQVRQDIDIRKLSEIELSGGLISNAVKKARILASANGRKFVIDTQLLQNLAKEEEFKMGKSRARSVIGFG
jgi:AAA+ superfamily predicted ATPase